MVKYGFSLKARDTLAGARTAASQFGHDGVATEHILLGLLGAGGSTARTVMATIGVDLERLRTVVTRLLVPGVRRPLAEADVRFTARSKKVIELSMAAARELGDTTVGTEHLLLGLLLEPVGRASDALREVGIDLAHTIEEVRRVSGRE